MTRRPRTPLLAPAAVLLLVVPLLATLAACGPGGGRPDVPTSRAPAGSSAPGPTRSPSTSPTTSPTPTTAAPSSSAPPPPSCAQRTLDGLDRTARIGQLLLVGVPAGDPGQGWAQLSGVPVGGVFLHGRSSAGVAAVAAQVAGVQAGATLPLLVAADQEGGLVQTLTGPGFDVVPRAVQQGTRSPAALRSATAAWAGQLRAAGVTLDLAPVADTVPAGTGAANPPIGAFDREYGSDPATVAASVTAVLGALQDAGVAATVKHFPGLGRVTVNTDDGPGATDPQTGPDDPYLEPFRAAVRAGTGAVMVSSATYPRLDPDHPAVFSPAVVGLLRGPLGFRGVVVTDDLGAAGAVASVPVGQRAVDAVAAGVDVVLTVRTADAVPMSAALAARADADPAFAARVDESALRVLELKERFGLLRC